MGPAVSAGQNLDGFGREAYERVSELIGMLPAYSRMVMVGCGAFPATLLWLRDQFSKSFHLGLDLDAQCVETARKLAEIMGFNDMSFKVMDGKDYDYDGVEFVYVANQVISKKSVLDQVSRSGSVARVVVREPTRKGELLPKLSATICQQRVHDRGRGGRKSNLPFLRSASKAGMCCRTRSDDVSGPTSLRSRRGVRGYRGEPSLGDACLENLKRTGPITLPRVPPAPDRGQDHDRRRDRTCTHRNRGACRRP